MNPEEELVNQLLAAGASKDEIFAILEERFPKASQATQRPRLLRFEAPVLPDARERPMQDIAGEVLGNLSNVGKAFGSGLKTSLKRTAGLAASSTSLLPISTAIYKATGEDLTGLRKAQPAPRPRERPTAPVETAAEFVGQLLGNLPVYAGVSGAVRSASTTLAGRVSDPVLKSFLTRSVPGSFWKSAAVSAPANVVEGVAADALLYPEQVQDLEGVLRSSALSLFGTIFDGFAGSKTLAEAIETATTPAQVKQVLDVIEEAKAQAPKSDLPSYEGKLVPYSVWEPGVNRPLPDAATISARRVEDLISGPMPTAAEIAMNRNTRVFNALADEKLRKAAFERWMSEPMASGSQVPIFNPLSGVRSLVTPTPTADDRILAASLQGAVDRTAESLKGIALVRKGSGRAIDNLSFIEADVSRSSFLFEELDELSKHLSLYFKRGQKELTPQQKFIVEVQDRLNAAAKKGYENMSVKEILDLEDSLLAMSRRLDEQGFDLPPKKFIGDVKQDPSAGKVDVRNRVTQTATEPSRSEPPAIVRFEPEPVGEKRTPRFLPRGYTLKEIEARGDIDFLKSLSNGDLPPKVTIVPAKSVEEFSAEVPKEVGDLIKSANIEYEKPKPAGPQPSARQLLQDKNIPLKELDQTAYDLLNNLGASRRAAENAVRYRGGLLLPKIDEAGRWIGEVEAPVEAVPLFEIQRLAGKRLIELEANLKALRTLADESIDTGMTVENARALVALYKNDELIQNLSAEYRKNMDFMIDYMVRLQRLDPKKGEQFKKLAYVPLGRMFNKPSSANFLSFRRGSERKSAPIFEQSIEMMYAVIERTQRNYAWLNLVNQLKENPVGLTDHISLAGSVNPGLFEEQIKELVAKGVPQKDAADWVRAMYSGTFDKTDGSLIVFDKGIASKYYVSDALALAVKAGSPMELGLMQNVMMALSTPMRESVALGLDLSGIGPASDAVLSMVNDSGYRLLRDTISGFWSSALRDENYLKSVAAGRGFGARLRPDTNIIPVKPAAKNSITAAVKTIPNAVTAVNNFIRPLSDAARMGLYLSQIRQGATPLEAATFSNNAIGNWNVSGAARLVRAWSLMTEFGNVGLQSGVAAAGTIKRALKSPKLAARAAMVGVGGLTVPTLILLSEYEDDDELNALRRADNYDYYYWRDSNGEPQKMRKPGWWLVPIFSSSVEAAWDGMDKQARARLAKSFKNSVTFNLVPISLQTALGLLNDDTAPLNPFVDIPIVPGGQQDVSSEIQGSLQSSQLAMALRDHAAISPFKTDYFLRQSLGSDLSALLTIATGGTVGTENRLPIFGRYSVSPRAQTEGSIQFYKDLKKSLEVDRTLKEYAAKQDMAGLEKYMEKNQEYVNLYSKLVGPSQQLAQFNLLLRMISADTTMTKEGKRNAEKYYRGLMNDFFIEYNTVRKELVK
jgi:hypothetical protein